MTLFVERARAAGREVQPDATVEAICRRIDCLPLAVELAAARTKVVDPDKQLARLDRALPLLTGGAHDAPERQRTLRVTPSGSYELLDDDAKPPFTRLSIFSGTFSLSAAEEICAAGIDELQAFVDLSLLKSVDGSRFLMLETIREYAREARVDR